MTHRECGVLNFELIEQAAERAAKQGMHLPDRIISVRAAMILKKIHHKYPDWDSWTVEPEIWVKAYKMGILEDE